MWVRDGDTGVRRGRGGTRGMQGYGGDTGMWWGRTCNGDTGVQWGHGRAMGMWVCNGDVEGQWGHTMGKKMCTGMRACDGTRAHAGDMRWGHGMHVVGTHAKGDTDTVGTGTYDGVPMCVGTDTCNGTGRCDGDRDMPWGHRRKTGTSVCNGNTGVMGTQPHNGDRDMPWGHSRVEGTPTCIEHTTCSGAGDMDTQQWGTGCGVRQGVCRHPPTRLVPAR